MKSGRSAHFQAHKLLKSGRFAITSCDDLVRQSVCQDFVRQLLGYLWDSLTCRFARKVPQIATEFSSCLLVRRKAASEHAGPPEAEAAG
jgi:hypothetical protein